MDFKILTGQLLSQFRASVDENFYKVLNSTPKLEIPVDYFQFYTSVSSVYSSKIEGVDIDFDSYFKYKFLNAKYKPDYTRKTDDLYRAYEYVFNNRLNLENLLKAHSILSANILPKSQQGKIRNTLMFVVNGQDRIEYVAAEPEILHSEIEKLFADIEQLLEYQIDEIESFYYASLIHLTFVKIHPFQDGNGRAGRLLEKWFLKEKIGERVISVPLERNYYRNIRLYYSNIKKLGVEYPELDYTKALDFLMMTINSLKETTEE